MKLEGVLRHITEFIVRVCDPEAVLLFGSYTKGQDNADSDLDLLVIGNFQGSPYLRGREVREVLSRYPIRVDLHLATLEEVARAADKPYSFLSTILPSSVTLYKKGIDKPKT